MTAHARPIIDSVSVHATSLCLHQSTYFERTSACLMVVGDNIVFSTAASLLLERCSNGRGHPNIDEIV